MTSVRAMFTSKLDALIGARELHAGAGDTNTDEEGADAGDNGEDDAGDAEGDADDELDRYAAGKKKRSKPAGYVVLKDPKYRDAVTYLRVRVS